MVKRFPNMLAVLYNNIKMGSKTCEMPVNKLCIQTLRLLREQNLIFGFQYVSKGETKNILFPRAKIYIKYADFKKPCITYLKSLNNKFSNFKTIILKYKIQESNVKKIMLTNSKGLDLVSINQVDLKKKKNKGKILMEISY